MSSIVDHVQSALASELEIRLAQPRALTRIIFVGPPIEILMQVSTKLGPTGAWNGPAGASCRVVLVGSEREVAASSHDGLASWDYVVGIRNGNQSFVALCTPEAWEEFDPKGSVATSVDVIGEPLSDLSTQDVPSTIPWPRIVEGLAGVVDGSEVAEALVDGLITDAMNVPIRLRVGFVWNTLSAALDARSRDDAFLAFGLPVPSSGTRVDVESARVTVRDFGQLVADLGYAGTAEVATETVAPEALDPLFDLLDAWESRNAFAAEASVNPIRDLAELTASDMDWSKVGIDTLEKLTGTRKSKKKDPSAAVEVVDGKTLGKGPVIFGVVARFRIEAQGAAAIRSIRAKNTGVAVVDSLVRDVPPAHERPIKYRFDAAGRRQTTIDSIVLSEFGARGIAVVDGAVKQSLPAKAKGANAFTQQVTSGRLGKQRATILVASGSKVSCSLDGETLEPAVGQSGCEGIASFLIEWEPASDGPVIVTIDDAGFQLQVDVQRQDERNSPRNRLESLVRAHQRGGREKFEPPVVVDRPIHSVEQAIQDIADSWKPVAMCWSASTVIPSSLEIDFGRASFGDVEVPSAGPSGLPSPRYLEAREAVRASLAAYRRRLAELDLGDPDILNPQLVLEYVNAYRELMVASPGLASRVDTVAIHAPTFNSQAGITVASVDPVALLLSPLHPVRLAWHAHVQHLLRETLDDPCPLVGFIDPNEVPAVLAFQAALSPSTPWKGFVAARTPEVHWGVYFSAAWLQEPHERRRHLAATFSRLGISVEDVVSGFTPSQTLRALDDLHAIKSAKPLLRIGLFSDSDEARGCVDGILDWCDRRFAADDVRWPLRADINDARSESTYPTNARLSEMAERTNGAVAWYRSPERQSDLVILDQLESTEPTKIHADNAEMTSRAPMLGPGFYRMRIRVDAKRPAGIVITESLAGRAPRGGGAPLSAAIFDMERLATERAGAAHMTRTPNVLAVKKRLERSSFVAATTDQFDPGAIIRGIADSDVVLWDFELPPMLGVGESETGYYLFSKSSSSLRDNLAATCAIAVDEDVRVDLDMVLAEISQRGVPVLKRMTGGGTHARGELGMLMAMRLLLEPIEEYDGAGLPVWDADLEVVNFVVPVDPFWEPLSQARRALMSKSRDEHCDLLVFSMRMGAHPRLRVTPVEVKFRTNSMSTEQKAGAVGQATNVGRLLSIMWSEAPRTTAWDVASRIMLAKCLDHGFRLYAETRYHGESKAKWTELHEEVVAAVFDATSLAELVEVEQVGRLVSFEQEVATAVTPVNSYDMNCVTVGRPDVAILLGAAGELSVEALSVAKRLSLSVGPPHGTDPTKAGHENETPPPASLEGERQHQTERAEERSLALGHSGRTFAAPRTNAGSIGERSDIESSVPSSPEGDPASVSQQASSPEAWNNPFISYEDNLRVQEMFSGFIGNADAAREIKNKVLVGLVDDEGPRLSENLLFHGRPSTGKTYLAQTMARALELPFVHIDGKALTKRDVLVDLVTAKLAESGLAATRLGSDMGKSVYSFPPCVILIDEVHLVVKSVQESLLTLLEPGDRRVVLDAAIAKMSSTTFLLATTRLNEVDGALRTRCSEVYLHEYSESEVADMVALKYPNDAKAQKLHASWPREAYVMVARFGETPRQAFQVARDLEQIMISSPNAATAPILEHVESLRRSKKLDATHGLGQEHRLYLGFLANRGTAGFDTIANQLGMDKTRVAESIEPRLMRLGLVDATPAGRVITPKGSAFLADLPAELQDYK